MFRPGRLTTLATAALAVGAAADPALAGTGQPSPWQLGLQDAVTPVFEQAHQFHNFLLIIITAITLFVLALLIYVVVRFREDKNPVPSKTTHHTLLEVAWTIIPVLILVAIAVPSFRLLYAQYTPPPTDLTIKVVGRQWNWDVVYPDSNGVTLTQLMLQPDELQDGQPSKLAVDNPAVVPVNKVVKVEVTAEDVIHAFAIPSFGVKVDAIPGRLNQTWFKAEKEGAYYGQCSELCGLAHAFMPIEIQVVSEETYKTWLEAAKADPEKAKDVLKQAKADAAAANKIAAR
ncbi:cytochrome c oxidase subunit II [Chelatococcus sambhunathii]|uniref:Cytochrome c oxidase subunit 2 n=1 Tax=Chelatococcus sambhunathii TaxID=363953 RepID=A0ABU1DK67_9HYPH|nr:cytochrome c oxidase subunit II [Chelatococcus sambhunathii]MDR4308513.1 cytochrome c oxidase subunit II [Chelatococcus sambhunathii]